MLDHRRRSSKPLFRVASVVSLLSVACSQELGSRTVAPSAIDAAVEERPDSAAAAILPIPEPDGAAGSEQSAEGLPPDTQSPTPETPAWISFHRLNRAEYQNTVHDLLGVKVDVRGLLEEDEEAAGFDNMASALDMTPSRYLAFFNAASVVADASFSDPVLVQRFVKCEPKPEQERSCARSTLEQLASRAYRRPVEDAELEALLGLYDQARALDSSFLDGLKHTVTSILRSAAFLYRSERDSEHPDSYAMASRLSYFLWSTMPDDELLRAAQADALLSPAEITTQVTRMLEDERRVALTDNFAAQWLGLRRLEQHQVDLTAFPTWDNSRLENMSAEARLYFQDFVDQNLSLSEFFTRDVNYVGWPFAMMYGWGSEDYATFELVERPLGIPEGSEEIRRAVYTGDERRGFLGLTGFLTLTSLAARTSPTLRGKWLLQNLLCQTIPDPPPGIPQLDTPAAPDQAPGTAFNVRTRLEAHRSNPSCNTCHALLDPAGLALEAYDATGQIRAWYPDGTGLDLTTTWSDGQSLSGLPGLTELLSKDEQFMKCVTSKLVTYALGHAARVGSPEVAAIYQRWSGQRTLRELIVATVTSDAFRARRVELEEAAP